MRKKLIHISLYVLGAIVSFCAFWFISQLLAWLATGLNKYLWPAPVIRTLFLALHIALLIYSGKKFKVQFWGYVLIAISILLWILREYEEYSFSLG